MIDVESMANDDDAIRISYSPGSTIHEPGVWSVIVERSPVTCGWRYERYASPGFQWANARGPSSKVVSVVAPASR